MLISAESTHGSETPVLIGQILTVNQKSTSDVVKLLLYDIKILCMT
jgi:hypothetical protein